MNNEIKSCCTTCLVMVLKSVKLELLCVFVMNYQPSGSCAEGSLSPVMVTSSLSFRKVLVSPPPRSMLFDPLHDSSSMEPKLSGSWWDTVHALYTDATQHGQDRKVDHSLHNPAWNCSNCCYSVHMFSWIPPFFECVRCLFDWRQS